MKYKKYKFKIRKLNIFLFILLCIVFSIYLGNNLIKETYIDVYSNNLPRSFNGYKILHLSDVHNKSFGKNQKNLVRKIKNINPDVIFITGDIVDSRRYNEAPSLELVKEIRKFAPIYYVPGNHEMRSGKLSELQKKLEESGAIVLRNENRIIDKNDEKIHIIGVDDPQTSYIYENDETVLKNEIEVLSDEIESATKYIAKNSFKVLLSHRPEKFSLYIESDMDVIFSGHTHGGQIRIPFIGAVIAPHQGFFPKYSKGIYNEGDSTMIISGGLGNSLMPIRLFNRPEIVVATLRNNN